MPDPAGLGAVDPTNPQSWNRYAYVLNNPLSSVDPTGLFCTYVNDAGNGVESIDSTGGSGECAENGGYWIQGDYGGGSWINVNSENGTVTGLGYDSSGNAEVSIAGAMGSNVWGAWTQTFGSGVAANNGPDPVAVANSMRQYVKNTLIIGPLQQLVKEGICGGSPSGAVKEGRVGGAIKGGTLGAFEGYAGTGVLAGTTFGGPGGAILGGFIGGTVGSVAGVFSGGITAGICQATGVYGW